MMTTIRLLITFLWLLPTLGAAHLRGEEERNLRAGDVIPNAYIVQFDDAVDLSSFPAQGNVPQFVQDLVPGKVPDHIYHNTIKGMAIRGLSASQAADLATKPGVVNVEPDRIMEASAASWGLDRIDQCKLPLDSNDSPSSASSVKMYILDTGIKSANVDFGGRVDAGCGFYSQGSNTEDGNGHGTHVASTACGSDFGVAKDCTLCAVKVLSDSGSGSNSGVIEGVDFVASNCQAGEKCVANMSLGGGFSRALNSAVNSAVNTGVVFVVAAGNDNKNAKDYSPASASGAITVGATDSSDEPAWFTNYGSDVNIYAPGVNIKAAWYNSNTATNTISGTSMASPHVAGIAAIMLEQGIAATRASIATELERTQTVVNVDSRTPNVGIAVIPGTLGPNSEVCSETGGGDGNDGGDGCVAVEPSCGVPCSAANCCPGQCTTRNYKCGRGRKSQRYEGPLCTSVFA